jgi:hypothetical protein
MTWSIRWTASANPDGPAQQPDLPDGKTTSEQNVSVQEIHAINR